MKRRAEATDPIPLPVSDAVLRGMADELLPILTRCERCKGKGKLSCQEVDRPHVNDGGNHPCPSCAGSGHDPKVRAGLVRMLVDADATREQRCITHRCGLRDGDTNTETCALHDWEKKGTGWSAPCQFGWVAIVPVEGEGK